jgi:hypothetical protein
VFPHGDRLNVLVVHPFKMDGEKENFSGFYTREIFSFFTDG